MSTKKDQGLGGILRGGIIAAVIVLLGSAALAQDPVERAGYFEVRSASTELINGVHMLDARLQLVLSSEPSASNSNTDRSASDTSSVTSTVATRIHLRRCIRRLIPSAGSSVCP
jgi:hypothetical protein